MTNGNEFKDLLDRLKGEVRSSIGSGSAGPEADRHLPEAKPAQPVPVVPERIAGAGGALRAPRPERVQAPVRPEFFRPGRSAAPSGANLIWSENKETMLFGALTSLVTLLGGILAGLDYVILIGAVTFLLFAFIMCLTLFGYYLNFRKKNSDEGLLSERVDQLARRLETLTQKGLSGPAQGQSQEHGKDKELEQKVDELRALVKALAKAVERQP